MSEEEAIKICKNIINDILGYTCFVGYTKEEYNQAIKTLLEMYHKQKEEIKELNKEFALNTEIHKRDEEIKELKETIKCLHEPAENYISKDKIREKIKELEKNNKHYVDMISGKEIRSLDDDKIDLLKELLED